MMNNETSFTGFAFFEKSAGLRRQSGHSGGCANYTMYHRQDTFQHRHIAPEFSRLMLPQGQPKRNRGNITNRAMSLIQNGDRDGKHACRNSSYAIFGLFIQGNIGVTGVVTS